MGAIFPPSLSSNLLHIPVRVPLNDPSGFGHTFIVRLSGAIIRVGGCERRLGGGRYRRDQINVTSEGKEEL